MQKESALQVNTPVPEILIALETKIKELKHIEDTVYRTTMNLEGVGELDKEKSFRPGS